MIFPEDNITFPEDNMSYANQQLKMNDDLRYAIVRRTNIAIEKCLHHTSLSVGHASPTGKKTFGMLCSIDIVALRETRL
jgi:hypothetical protein